MQPSNDPKNNFHFLPQIDFGVKYVILDQMYEIYQPALIHIPTLTEYEFCFSVFQLTEQQVVSCRLHGQANLPVHLPPVQPVWGDEGWDLSLQRSFTTSAFAVMH